MPPMDDLPELPTLAALENPAPSASKSTLRPLPPASTPVVTPIINEVLPAPATITVKPETTTKPVPPAVSAPSLDLQPWSSMSSTHAVVEAEETSAPATPRREERLLSLDAYRGAIMLLMVSGGLGIVQMGKQFPDTVWASLAPLLNHVPWQGGVPWDMIQPAFMFMVGVSMPFSYAKRMESGESGWQLFFHALGRAMVLVLLGVLCSSGAKDVTNWTFTNVLSQIGLGYVFLFLMWRTGTWGQLLGSLAILGGYWAWFAYSPLQPPAVTTYPEGVFEGFFAHWNMNANAASAFDQWFLNRFPRIEPFVASEGGYQTLNFIPAIVTMCMGLIAGRFIRSDRTHAEKVVGLIGVGAAVTVLGIIAGDQLCPIVKRIWTPSWVLFSGGIVTILLASFYFAVEVLRARWLAWPLAVVGMNSILVYLLDKFSKGWIKDRLHQHLEPDMFKGQFAPMIESGAVLGVIWLLCWYLYRQRAFLRI